MNRVLMQISNIEYETRKRFRSYVKRQNVKSEKALSHLMDLAEKEEELFSMKENK